MNTAPRDEFAQWAEAYGLKASDFGAVVHLEGVAHRIGGLLSPKLSRRFPVQLSRVLDGAVVSCSVLAVRTALRQARSVPRRHR